MERRLIPEEDLVLEAGGFEGSVLEARLERGKVCNRCGERLPLGFKAACGIKNPCPRCGYLYPVGDCAD